MGFDPQREDYERMGLRQARALASHDPFSAARAAVAFGRTLAHNRDSLPQTDADRAFHLVAEAALAFDYRVGWAPDDEAGEQARRGEARRLLREALELDPECHDATRMLLLLSDGVEPREACEALGDGAESVLASCEARRREAEAASREDGRALACDLAMRPYLRWRASQAECAVAAARYRQALGAARAALELDPSDRADARMPAYLALAKLEDRDGLERLAGRLAASLSPRHGAEPLLSLCRMAVAWSLGDVGTASRELEGLVRVPGAGTMLSNPVALSGGTFSHFAFEPGGPDELSDAVSQATILFDEGRDGRDVGPLAAWTASRGPVLAATLRDELATGLGELGPDDEGGEA